MKCAACGGRGWYEDHDSWSTHDADGTCNTCPVETQCEKCQGTGEQE